MSSPGDEAHVVDVLSRLVLAARRLGCRVHLTDVDPALRATLELTGVEELIVECPAAAPSSDATKDLR